MITALGYAGDALWILALTIMFGVSRGAAQRTEARTLPVAGVQMNRHLVLWALPGGAFLGSLWLLEAAHNAPGGLDAAIVIFGIRALLASVLAQIHLRIVRGAVKP